MEIPYIEGELPYPGRKPKQSFPKGLIQELPTDENGHLQKISELTPYFTPGHSPGHVVFYHEEDDVLLVGDLFNSKNGKLRKPRFTPDLQQAVQSSQIVRQLNPHRLEVCHGDTVFNPLKQLDEYIRSRSH